MVFRRLALPVLLAQGLFASSPAFAAGVLDNVVQNRTLRIGHRMAAAPLSYVIEGQKAPTGYVTDICLALAEGIKRELKLPELNILWVPTTSADRFKFAMEHKIDLECATTTVTAERRQKYAEFTAPHFIAGAGVLTLASFKAKTLSDLKGKTIALQKNSTSEKVVKMGNDLGWGMKTLLVENNEEGLAAIDAGKAHAVMDDDVVLAMSRVLAKDPAKLALLDSRHTIEPLAIMYPKDDPQWRALVDRLYGALVSSGEVPRLYQKWFMQPIPPKGLTLNLRPSRFLRETFRHPTKLEADANIVKLQ